MDKLSKASGDRIGRGLEVKAIDHEKLWEFKVTAKEGDEVVAGDELGTVQETVVVLHKIMVPNGIEGKIIKIVSDGKYNIDAVIAEIKTSHGVEKVTMVQNWAVRKGRPYKHKLNPAMPMVTGQRVIDTFSL